MLQRAFLSLLVLISLQKAAAQNWCIPGATWTFEYEDVLGGVIGHARVDHTQDTVLNGAPSQRLDVFVNAYSYQSQSYWTEQHVGIQWTTGTDDIVQLWNASESAFDTLYWFSALPGDHWSVPWTYGMVPDFIALDTTHTVIDGITLRQVVVGLDVPFPEPFDTLTERLGFHRIFIDAQSAFMVDQPISWLRCYHDDDIAFMSPYWAFGCASVLGAGSRSTMTATAVFPNPGTDHFTMELPAGAHAIEVLDATGQRVLSQRSTTQIATLSTRLLAEGIYVVRVDGTRTARWVKQ